MGATSLKPGGILGVCAPSASFDSEKLNRGIRVLKQLGFEVRVPEEIFEKKRYLAGNDKLRAGVINRLFADPDIDGIICARGGFGAMRVLDHLDWDLIRQHAKPFIGFSDCTALLLTIIHQTGSKVIHGPNVVSFADAPPKTVDSFYDAVQGAVNTIEISSGQIIKPGKCAGLLKGGNLCTISHLLGTRYQPDFKDCIVFMEEVGEPAYKIDRMLTQMKMAGLFTGIRGVVTGSFENCDNDEYLEDIIRETFEAYDVPIISGLDSGHGRINLSLCMGADVKMDAVNSRLDWI